MDETKAQEQREFEHKCLQLRQDDPTLTYFIMGSRSSYDDVCSKDYILLGQSLMGNSHLRYLSLLPPIVEERVARVLATGIAQSKLLELCFVEKQQLHIWQILLEGMRSLSSLQELTFITVTAEALSVLRNSISSFPLLQKLNVFDVSGSDYGLSVSQILMKTSSLTSLRLIEVKYLGEIGITVLAHALRSNTSVTTLQLSQSNICDSCLESFLELWLPTSPIRELSLDGNNIRIQGAQQLLRAVANHPAMQVLNLRHNKNVGYDGLLMIGVELLSQTNLAEMDVSGCSTWHEYQQPDCEQARAQDKALQLASHALIEAVKQNVRIKELKVDEQRLPSQVENEISFYANLNEMGRYLLSTNHGLASTVWCYIFAKCQSSAVHNKSSLIYFFLCAQPSLAPQAAMKRRRFQLG
jgi:hypothetical protein